MLEIKNLTKIYRTKGGADVRALDNVSLAFEDTGMVFLLGKSGSGKSTLLNLIGGLDRPDGGEIIVKGRGSKTFSTSDFDSYRNTFVGFIFQEYNILNEFTVEDNIAIALELQGKSKDKAKIAEILRSVEMEQFAKRKPNTLSGGQKQRIAIARALVKEPEIIMADEPTGALDSATGKQVFDTLKKLSEEKLVIVVSHDREFAEIYGDRIIELKDGKVIADITKRKIVAESASENVSYIGENTISVKSGAKLTPQDIKNIEKFILSAPSDVLISNDGKDISAFKKQARIDENGSREQFFATETDKIEVKNYKPEESRFIRSKLPLRHAVKIGASSMKVKPFRLFFTILLTFVSFVMFGLFSTLMLFNEQQTLTESLMMSGDEFIVTSKWYYYTTNNYLNGELENSYESYGGAGFKEGDLQEVWDNLDGNAVFAFNYTAEYYSNPEFRIYNANNLNSDLYTTSLKGFAITAENSMFRNEKILWGKYPESSDELMISDYTFTALKECGKLHVMSPDGENSEVTINDYNDLSDVPVYITGSDSQDVFKHPYRICGVYQAQSIPEKYTSGDSANENRYMWQSEFDGGFYAYAIVDETFYDANKDYLGSGYSDNWVDQSQYFRWASEQYVIRDDGDNNCWVGGAQKLPPESNYKSFDVYGQDGSKINAITGNQVALEADNFGSIISNSVWNYINNYDGDNSEIYNEWNTAEEGQLPPASKVDIFRTGKNYGSEKEEQVSESQRLEYLQDVMAFVDKYNIPLFENFVLANANSELGGTEVEITGFFFGGDRFRDYIYCSEENVNLICRENNDVWTQGIESKYDRTGDKYCRAIFIKDAGTIDEIIGRSVDRQEDDTYLYVNNAVVSQLNSFISLIEVLSQVFLYVGIAFAVFSMLLLFNFISVSIVNKKKEIGILRAVGARSADVFKIFYSETVIITGICLILSVVVSFFLCSIFNNMIAAELGMPLALFVFGPISVAIMIGIAIVTSVISTFMPVYSIAKKRPVESIRAL